MTTAPGNDSPPHRIRVLVADLSGVLAQLVVHAIEQQPNLQLVGQVQGSIEVLLAAGTGVDVIVLGAPCAEPPPNICSHLLSEFPDLRILVLAATGDSATLYWRGLRRRRVRTVSMVTLQSNIRHAYELNPVE